MSKTKSAERRAEQRNQYCRDNPYCQNCVFKKSFSGAMGEYCDFLAMTFKTRKCSPHKCLNFAPRTPANKKIANDLNNNAKRAGIYGKRIVDIAQQTANELYFPNKKIPKQDAENTSNSTKQCDVKNTLETTTDERNENK